MLFEWDESKRRTNLAKHRIDFQDAKRIFDGPAFERVDSRHGENRSIAIGLMEDVEIVVVYTVRNQRRRIISARRANCNERQEYGHQLPKPRQGQD
jgi:uncharacterized DUF497 family protein